MNPIVDNKLIANKYLIKNKIGNGKFGIVYCAENIKTKEFVAIKTEDSRTEIKILKYETTILKYLYDHGVREIPIVYWYGLNSNSLCLVMPMYERSLYDYVLNNPTNDISKINSFMIVLINIIQSIHKCSIIHRDIKPQNFMIKNNELFCIDFGFATFFVDENSRHLPLKNHNNIIGTPKYISINIHNGNTASRRDDLISMGYILIFLLCRELPWDALKKTENPENLDEIHIMHPKNTERNSLKSWNHLQDLCKNMNDSLHKYLNYCYSLEYHEAPDYDLLRTFFSNTRVSI
jgi:casein kinase 1